MFFSCLLGLGVGLDGLGVLVWVRVEWDGVLQSSFQSGLSGVLVEDGLDGGGGVGGTSRGFEGEVGWP